MRPPPGQPAGQRDREDPTEVERIRAVYAERDRAAGRRHPAIGLAYGRLATERRAATLALLREGAPAPRGRIVDVGCGSGSDLRHLRSSGWDADCLAGVDLVEDRVERARAACPGVDIRLAEGASLPFRTASFDAATAVTVLSSVRAPGMRRAIFAEMGRIVRPGGLIVVYDFVVRKPTNTAVVAMPLRRLAELGRPPDGSIRLSPLLQLVAAGELLGPRVGATVAAIAPRTHRLSW
ncbi:MAG TPA: class I SAM-dependent methyltransferase, partial [Candidatus Binatus sp.]|nr:class I SAM-dependent methyltransferase [Candidatus Binatus sp.]